MAVIVLDFDGTVVTHDYPEVGEDIGSVPVLKKIVESGHKIVLFTMRDKKELDDSVEWFRKNEIPLYGIQRNPTQDSWTSSPKAYGSLIIDDASLGAPLMFNPSIHSRPFIDWDKAEKMLKQMSYII